MARTLGLVLGGLMLVDGLTDTINPHLGYRIWNQYVRRYAPGWLNQPVEEYSRLSDTSLRYVTVWEVLMGLMMLWLASLARE